MKQKQLKPADHTPEDAARIEHDVQTLGAISPETTRTIDGVTVAEAQASARRVNDEWHAERLRQAEAKKEKLKAEPASSGDNLNPPGADKTDAE